MTEAEWLTTDDIARMQRFIGSRTTARKLELFPCAAYHQISLRLQASGRGLAFRHVDLKPWNLTRQEQAHRSSLEYARDLLRLFWPLHEEVPEDEALRLQAILPRLARCVFGNPFRPVTIDAAYMTPTVRALAQAAYDEGERELDAGRLAVLADALEEAGASGELLEHLRGPGPHARGCWAVDACLAPG